MAILLTILSICIVLLVSFSYFLVIQYKKIKKSRSIQFSNLLDNHGDYGMKILEADASSSKKFHVEFKVISRTKNKNTSSEYLNIRVLNVSCVTMVDIDTKETQKGIQQLYNTLWIYDNNINWYTDNDARRRDDILTDLLKDEKK